MMPLLGFITFLLLVANVSTQSTGDLRLEGSTNANFGRLEIFWNKKWSTFCGVGGDSFTIGAAQAACRQLGYLDAFRAGTVSSLNFSRAGEGTPIAFGKVNCDYNFASGALHILRCDTSEVVPSSCSHEDDVAIMCEPLPLWEHPYETQVRLMPLTHPAYYSTGVLEIYNSGLWGNVCFMSGSFDESAADSACRQMGYTNSVTFKGVSSTSADTVWLDGILCGSRSQSCIKCCGLTLQKTPISCSSGNYVFIQCTFNIAFRNKTNYSSGSESLCEIPDCHNTNSSILAVTLVIVISLIVIIAVLIFLCVCCLIPSCTLYKWRQEKLYGYSSNM